MTSVCVTRVPRGHYRFWHVARMEWIKLRTLRSTWWTMGIGVAGAVAIGVAVGRATKSGWGDLTNNGLAGMVPRATSGRGARGCGDAQRVLGGAHPGPAGRD